MKIARSLRAAQAHPETTELLILRISRQRSLPDAVGDLPCVREINLEVGPTFDMAGALRTLSRIRSLRTLRFQYTPSPALPDEIGLLPQLTRLDLWDTQTPHISPAIFSLTGLECLMLRGVSFPALPEAVAELTRLEALGLSACPVSALPAALGTLSRLSSLFLERLPLSVLPPELAQLPRLTYLHLTDTPIQALPPLKTVRVLYLRRGQLSEAEVRAALSPECTILWEDAIQP